jgi:hypothetical protein
VKPGDLLRRRGDARWFVVVRDDAFEDNLELHETGQSGLGFFMKREELPKSFEDPARSDASGVPR